MPETALIPRVLWAQQREAVLLTVAVPDLVKVNVTFEEQSVTFRGQSNSDKTIMYEVKIDLYEKIDTETSKYENIGQKFWRLLLKKKDSSIAFWPRLTKDKARLHWLQTDFDHWKDENESEDEQNEASGGFQDMFSGGKIIVFSLSSAFLSFDFASIASGMDGLNGMDDMPGMDDDSDDAEMDDMDDDKSLPKPNETNNEFSKQHEQIDQHTSNANTVEQESTA
jgi:hypothetical protein